MTVNKYVALLLLGTLLYSCSSTRQIKKCERCFKKFADTATVIIDSVSISYDTVTHIISINADTSIQILVIECDSLGNASIKNTTTTKGSRSDLNSTLENNVLNIQATCKEYVDSINVLNKIVERIKKEVNTVFVPKLVEAQLTWWQKIKVKYGGYALIAWLIVIIIFVGRKFLRAWIKSNLPLNALTRWL